MTRKPPLSVTSWHEMPGREVYLCAVGARTPLGLDSASSAAAVRGGISAFSLHSVFVDKTGSPMQLANDAMLAPHVSLGERLAQLLVGALEELTEQASWSCSAQPVPCWIGMAEPRPGVTAEVVQTCARAAAAALGTSKESIHRIHQGHASGLMAIQTVAQQISAGHVDLGIAAGVDSYHDADTLDWLDQGGKPLRLLSLINCPP